MGAADGRATIEGHAELSALNAKKIVPSSREWAFLQVPNSFEHLPQHWRVHQLLRHMHIPSTAD